MIDSHCHPQFHKYNEDPVKSPDGDHGAGREEMIRRALDAGVGMIAVGTDVETTQQGIALAEKYPNLWATAGLHPTEASNVRSSPLDPEDRASAGATSYVVDNFVEFMSHNKVVGVGEVGLDYYRITDPEVRIKQKEIFESFIELAQKYQKPLILHLRNSPDNSDAFSDARFIIENCKLNPPVGRAGIENSTLCGVVHSFTGDLVNAQAFIAQGFLIGLNGIITFTNQHDDLVRSLPLDKILLETDAPFLTPVPHRGQRNEPLWVKYVAEKIAQVKNIPVDEVIRQTVENTVQLFKLSVE